jgi:basic amino acid/polyamine antiporter, APA family
MMRAIVASCPQSSDPHSLKPTLNLWDLICLLVGAVIGSGIFLVPGAIMRDVGGSVKLSLIVWLAGGFLSLLGALTYGELAAENPAAGGLYVYIRDAFGALPAFLYGWTLFLVIAAGTTATLAVAFANYFNEITPLTALEMKLAALFVIILVTAVNAFSTRHSANLNNWSTVIKVTAIVAMSVILFALAGRHPHAPATGIAPAGGSVPAGFGLAMIAVLWAYEGWQWITYSASETLNPQRNFPRGFLIGTLVLIFCYVLPVIAYVAALGPADAAKSDTIAAAAMTAVLGPYAGKLVAAIILVSVFSAALTTCLTAPRVFYAMAQDRLFFSQLGKVHPRFHTPVIAIVTSGIWSAVLAWTGTFERLFTYVIFAGWVFYGLSAASIFVFRRRAPNAKRAYSVPGYPFTPLLFVLAATALVLNTIAADWKDAAFGLVIIALGVPAYLFWHFRRKPANPSSSATRISEPL